MGLFPDARNYGLRMRLECRKRFPCHRLQRKLLVDDPGIHHGTCVTHVPWCMSGLLTRDGGVKFPNIPGACITHNFAYLVRGSYPCTARMNATVKHVDFHEGQCDVTPQIKHCGLTICETTKECISIICIIAYYWTRLMMYMYICKKY